MPENDHDEFDPEAALEEYDERYLLCRDPGVRHPWTIVGWFRDAHGAHRRRVRCDRCGAERDDIEDGWRVRHVYNHPEGYKLGGRVHSSDVRAEERRRMTVYPSLEAMEAAKRRPKRRRRSA